MSSTARTCRDTSMTMATLQHWPARLVPAPRGRIGTPYSRQVRTVSMMSSVVLGSTTPIGVWR
jgi:hypothetical protein